MTSHRHARLLLVPLLMACTLPAAAVDCTVNVLDAHNIAKQRGWTFRCHASTLAGLTYGFVTYPPNAIGCTFKTPPVIGVMTSLGSGAFFMSETAPGARPELRNGWRVKTYQIVGGQWKEAAGYVASVRIAWATAEIPKPSRTYNFMLNKLVLNHPSGSCSKALDEAF